MSGVVIGRLRLFQIAEERISLGNVLVDVGFSFLCLTFEILNLFFLAFEPALVAVKIIFTRFFSPFCRHDLTAQLLYLLLNSCAGLLVAECFKCLIQFCLKAACPVVGLIVFGLGCIDVRLHGGKGFPPFGGFRHHHVVEFLKCGNVIIDFRKFLRTCGVFRGLEVFERFLHGCIRFFFCGGRIFRLQGNCTGGGAGFCRNRRYGGDSRDKCRGKGDAHSCSSCSSCENVVHLGTSFQGSATNLVALM